MMDDRLRMTPGPTEVPAAVRERASEPAWNPDVEPEFLEFYTSLRDKLETIYAESANPRSADGSSDLESRDVVVLSGEGILGLEAAVASVVGEGDDVLCISNGVYGDGFADFVELYGGEPETCRTASTEPLDLEAIEATLADGEFEAATMVHCETPTGILNDLEPVLEVLDEHGVLSIVDAVSSLGGTPVPVEDVDVCIGASQKCFSAPPGLAVLSISDRAWEAVESTETRSFYADLEPWRDAVEEEWFPYTQPTTNLLALDAAADLIVDEGLESVFDRHERAARLCRERAAEMGLSLYPASDAHASPTVTALHVEGRAAALQERMREDHDIVLSTGLAGLEDDVLRVGHMGHNAREDRVERTMDALEETLESA